MGEPSKPKTKARLGVLWCNWPQICQLRQAHDSSGPQETVRHETAMFKLYRKQKSCHRVPKSCRVQTLPKETSFIYPQQVGWKNYELQTWEKELFVIPWWWLRLTDSNVRHYMTLEQEVPRLWQHWYIDCRHAHNDRKSVKLRLLLAQSWSDMSSVTGDFTLETGHQGWP